MFSYSLFNAKYQRKGWFFKANTDISQCHQVVSSDDEKGEGCNVHGIVALSSGGGNLHLAPGRGLENFGKKNQDFRASLISLLKLLKFLMFRILFISLDLVRNFQDMYTNWMGKVV